jgi:glutamate N-acetyltransferase / amino-acid N-acetyltransferase
MEPLLPNGFRIVGLHCGIKSESKKKDLALFYCDRPAVAAGVYTRNLVRAASIDWNRAITPSNHVRCVVLNSGNANACTGTTGKQDNFEMATIAAECFGGTAEQTLVLSTGVIGQRLPMEIVSKGIKQAYQELSVDPAAITDVNDAMITTDSTRKISFRKVVLDGSEYRLLALAKGAGMIGPNMATMLAVIMTDAPLSAQQADVMLRSACDRSFNNISVEGHTSTNDAVLLLSSGDSSGETLTEKDANRFTHELVDMSIELAKQIPADGEGATHLIQIRISGADSDSNADKIARTIANSALVKTAITGADPNWGRIVSAAGYAGVYFRVEEVTLHLNDVLLFKTGNPVAFDEHSLSQSMHNSKTIEINLIIGSGPGSATHWTSNLTHDYIRINADYHT